MRLVWGFFSLHKEAGQGEPGALGALWMLGFLLSQQLSGLEGYFDLTKNTLLL